MEKKEYINISLIDKKNENILNQNNVKMFVNKKCNKKKLIKSFSKFTFDIFHQFLEYLGMECFFLTF